MDVLTLPVVLFLVLLVVKFAWQWLNPAPGKTRKHGTGSSDTAFPAGTGDTSDYNNTSANFLSSDTLMEDNSSHHHSHHHSDNTTHFDTNSFSGPDNTPSFDSGSTGSFDSGCSAASDSSC